MPCHVGAGCGGASQRQHKQDCRPAAAIRCRAADMCVCAGSCLCAEQGLDRLCLSVLLKTMLCFCSQQHRRGHVIDQPKGYNKKHSKKYDEDSDSESEYEAPRHHHKQPEPEYEEKVGEAEKYHKVRE